MFLNKLKDSLSARKPPFVYICGAGPGDAKLLTIASYILITEIADVVVYDRLIPDEIISLIPERIEKIYAGKSCRNHHMTQDEINHVLVEEAKKGRVVVRLKGGDPFIFGRGGEEAEYLVDNNVDFTVIPGVNAADGCCAYSGIPLTHRGLANSVRFFTGHQQKGVAPDLDWDGLANPDTTLVVYMGLTNLSDIAKNLICHGLDKDTPVAAIQNGTTSSSVTIISTLKNISDEVLKAKLASPTLIIIGKVVLLANKLNNSLIV